MKTIEGIIRHEKYIGRIWYFAEYKDTEDLVTIENKGIKKLSIVSSTYDSIFTYDADRGTIYGDKENPVILRAVNDINIKK